jgi:hypothetical protein
MALIPDEAASIITAGRCSMVVGTRDARLEPHFVRALGAAVHDDREQLTFFVPRVLAATVISDLEDNGRIAFQIVDVPTFHAFQLKGRMLELRDARPDEEALQLAYREAIASSARSVGIPDGYWWSAVLNPAVAITFRIEETFNQTPGPGAGAPIG